MSPEPEESATASQSPSEPEGPAGPPQARSEVDAIIESIIGHLSALDALGTGSEKWLEEDQVRFVRIVVEEGMSELQRADDARLEFMAECAMLAGENMQDARFAIIDEKGGGTENTFGGFLVNLGLMLAVELLVVAGATYALPAVLAFAAARAEASALQRLATQAATTREKASGSFISMKTVVADKLKVRDELIMSPPNRFAYPAQIFLANAAVTKARHEHNVALQALETSEEFVKQVKDAVAAASRTEPVAKFGSSKLQEFLDGALSQASLARVAENSASAFTTMALGAPGGGVSVQGAKVFQSSTPIGRFLSEVGRERNELASGWADARVYLRTLTDAQFMSNHLAHKYFFRIHNQPATAKVQEYVAADRDPMIRGIEGVLWLAWLRHIDALGATRATAVPFRDVGVGHLSGNLLIEGFSPTGRFSTTREMGADGTVFSGLDRITDPYAEYLYGRFAHDFFVQRPEHLPKPFEFVPSRYTEVAKMPMRYPTGFENIDRVQRVAEMKLLVIVFFRLFGDNPSEIGGPGGSEARAIIKKILAPGTGFSPVEPYEKLLPPQTDPEVSEDPEGLSDPSVDALMSALESAPERVARDASTKLASMVTDLDLMITQYPDESFDDSAAGAAAKAEADELLLAIEKQQDAVRKQYDLALVAAGPSPVLDEVRAYEPRVNKLCEWPPPVWKWYGPPAPDELPPAPPQDPPVS